MSSGNSAFYQEMYVPSPPFFGVSTTLYFVNERNKRNSTLNKEKTGRNNNV